MNQLTPEQSADVIRWQHDAANHEFRQRGWRDKIGLARVALRCATSITAPRQTATGGATEPVSLLSYEEQANGLDFLIKQRQEVYDRAAGALSDEDYARAEKLADQGVAPIGDARDKVRRD